MREVFKERYGFLLESAKLTENERSYPAFNFKDGGLFHSWLQLTPAGMRQPFQQELERSKYDSLEKFFEAYFDYLDDTSLKVAHAKLVDKRILDIPDSKEFHIRSSFSGRNSAQSSEKYQRYYNRDQEQRVSNSYQKRPASLNAFEEQDNYNEEDDFERDEDEILAMDDRANNTNANANR